MTPKDQDPNAASPQRKPVAKMENPDTVQPREPGGWEGKVWYAPDYDEADAEIEKMFNED